MGKEASLGSQGPRFNPEDLHLLSGAKIQRAERAGAVSRKGQEIDEI